MYTKESCPKTTTFSPESFLALMNFENVFAHKNNAVLIKKIE
jgi:hypothetical protein